MSWGSPAHELRSPPEGFALRYTTYVLNDEGQPEVADHQAWSDYWSANDPRRSLGSENWQAALGTVRVKTEFVGVSAGDADPPELWKTDAFLDRNNARHNNPELLRTVRYTSREAAVEGHTRIVEELREEFGSAS